MKFRKVSGVVAHLHITQDEENFVQTRAHRTLGGAAAVGLAMEGLAGAATGAMLSSGDMAERMDFFACTIAGENVWGRFGTTSFKNGDSVESVGESNPQGFVVVKQNRTLC